MEQVSHSLVPVGVTLSLDETGVYPLLTVSGPRHLLTKAIIRVCHNIAGDNGAGIEFKPT